MSAIACKVVITAEVGGFTKFFPIWFDAYYERIELEWMLRRSLYWWQRLARKVGLL